MNDKEFTTSVLIILWEIPTLKSIASPRNLPRQISKGTRRLQLNVETLSLGGDTFVRRESVTLSSAMQQIKIAIAPTQYCILPKRQSYLVVYSEYVKRFLASKNNLINSP